MKIIKVLRTCSKNHRVLLDDGITEAVVPLSKGIGSHFINYPIFDSGAGHEVQYNWGRVFYKEKRIVVVQNDSDLVLLSQSYRSRKSFIQFVNSCKEFDSFESVKRRLSAMLTCSMWKKDNYHVRHYFN